MEDSHELSGAAQMQSITPQKKPKSFRKLLSKKLGFKHAERADTSTVRESTGEREPIEDDSDLPAVEEREISALNDKGNDFFGKGEFDAALRMYSEALKLLKNPRITMDMELGSEEEEDVSKGMRRFRTARLLVNIGAVHIRRENYDEAISVLEMSMRSSKLVPVESSYYYRSCEVVADALENTGLVFYKLKNYEESSTRYADALVARRKCIEYLNEKFTKQKGPKSNEVVMKYKQEVSACKLELANTLFYMALLRERQDKIGEAIMRCVSCVHIRLLAHSMHKTDESISTVITGGIDSFAERNIRTVQVRYQQHKSSNNDGKIVLS
jgi:tetratricopeptide (TPR) repeat protein